MIVGEDRERRLEIPSALAVAFGNDQQAFHVAVAADLFDGDEEVLQTISGRRQSASRTSPWRQAVKGVGEESDRAGASDAADEVRRVATAFRRSPPGGTGPVRHLPSHISGAGRIGEVGSLPYFLYPRRLAARRP